MSASAKKRLQAIFEGLSDDEEFYGFGGVSSEEFSEESRDSFHSQTFGKLEYRFKSKFITDELAQLFMDTDSEDEFKGFTNEERAAPNTHINNTALESEDDSDDIGFYSDDDNPAPQKKRNLGLCVAFRFPAKKSSTHEVPTKSSKFSKAWMMPSNNQPLDKSRKRRGDPADYPGVLKNRKMENLHAASFEGAEEESAETDVQILSQRAKNIQENKAMLAKLFADLSVLPELSPKTTPTIKKKQQTPRRRLSDMQSERRNPDRKARPPEHFGLEQKPVNTCNPRKSMEIDLNKLLEVDEEMRGNMHSLKRKCKKRSSMRMPEDITEEELDNVADRAKDKMLDKEHGSTCHQCRQKTLDTKTECRNPYCQGVKGQFCGPCLRNRYGEDVRTALLDPTWVCPLCRGICNCSLCRKRDGRCATGPLTPLAKHYGFDSVKEYLESLQKNLDLSLVTDKED